MKLCLCKLLSSFKVARMNVRLASSMSYNRAMFRKVKLDHDIFTEHVQRQQGAMSFLTPIVICHGLFGSRMNWRSLSKAISQKTGHKVVTYDAVNHGTSSHHPNMSYEDLAFDLVKLLDQLHITKAILMGHSMGGKTVMTAALTCPDRVEKLIVVDSAPSLSKSAGEVLTYLDCMKAMDLVKVTSKREVEEMLRPLVKKESVIQFLMTNLVETPGGFKWRINMDAIEKNYPHLHDFPRLSGQYVFDEPTLFIGGEKSYYITGDDLPDIFSYFPNAFVRHIEGAGHWVHSDKPSAFLELATSFIVNDKPLT